MGKFTGKPYIWWQKPWFPVDFPLNQSKNYGEFPGIIWHGSSIGRVSTRPLRSPLAAARHLLRSACSANHFWRSGNCCWSRKNLWLQYMKNPSTLMIVYSQYNQFKKHILYPIWLIYPLVNWHIENGHWNSGFTHQKWWFSIVTLVYRRVTDINQLSTCNWNVPSCLSRTWKKNHKAGWTQCCSTTI